MRLPRLDRGAECRAGAEQVLLADQLVQRARSHADSKRRLRGGNRRPPADLGARVEEALAFHVEGMAEDGDAIPEPSSLEQIMADPENRDAVAVLIPLREQAARTVRVNITLPEATLAEIDRYAEAHGFTRSGFLAQAAKRAIEQA